MPKRFVNATSAFEFFFQAIKLNGELFAGTKAFFNVSFTIIFPEANTVDTPWRKWKLEYAKLEYEWYMSGDRNPDMVAQYAKLWDSIRDERGYVNSNYGNWWKRNNQLKRVKEMIRKDRSTRRAIITHYNPDEVQDYTKDTPCNIVLNFYVRKESLHLTIFARSIDLVYGFCNDQYCFSQLLIETATDLGLIAGEMTFHITNLHIYEKHWTLNEKF